MSAEAAAVVSSPIQVPSRRVFRYAVGSTLAMAVAMGWDWNLSYLLPVLSLSFLATPDPCPTLRQGIRFFGVVAMATLAGLLLGRILLPFPMVYVPFVGLILFRLFYAKASGRSSLLNMWLMIAVLVIPLVTMVSAEVATLVALGILASAAATIALVWVAYSLFPDPLRWHAGAANSAGVPKPQSLPLPRERLRIAGETVLVVLPVFLLFYTLRLTGSMLILVFITVLSTQPGFAKDFKAGAALVLGNVIGGAAAILCYELLVVVPEFPFLIALTLLAGLVFGAQVFSGKKTAPLFGMAYSTLLLVIGSTTSGHAEAGGKVLARVVQIMIAVIYVVTAFGVLTRLRKGRRA